MKNLKRAIALVLTYVMVVMVLPLNAIKTSAAVNVPQYLNMSDLYVRSIAQYKNKALITYSEHGYTGDAILSLVTNGEEKIISKPETTEDTTFNFNIIDTNKTYVIEEMKVDKVLTMKYYYFDYNTEKLVEISKDEVEYDKTGHSYDYKILHDDEIKNQMLDIINEKYNMEYTLYNYETGEGNAEVNVREVTIDGASMYEFNAFTRTAEKSEEYYGIVNDKIDILIQGYHDYMNSYDWNSGYYLVLEGSGDARTLYLIKGGEIVKKCEVDSDFSFYSINIEGDTICSRPYGENTYYEYAIENGKLVIAKSIAMTSKLTGIPYDKDGNMWTVIDENGKRYVAKVEAGKPVYKYEIAIFEEQTWGTSFQMYVHDENNIVVSTADKNKTIFIQNEVPPVVPPVIEDIIDEDIVEIVTGNGSEETPLELEVKEVKAEELEAFLASLEELDAVVSKVEKGDEYTIFYIKVKSMPAARAFALASSASDNVYIKLVVRNEYTELVESLNSFAESNKEEITPEEPKPEDPKPEQPKPEEPVVPSEPTPETTEKDKESENKADTLPETGAKVGATAVVLMSTLMIVGGAALSFRKKEKRN